MKRIVKKTAKILGIIILILLLVVIIGPFLIPIPPLDDIEPVEQLADPDSKFTEVNGIQVHYKMAGSGQPVYVLLHGFAASLFSWREVYPQLAERGTVMEFDRPAFGLTERPLSWKGTAEFMQTLLNWVKLGSGEG